jgi:hypothetical protein
MEANEQQQGISKQCYNCPVFAPQQVVERRRTLKNNQNKFGVMGFLNYAVGGDAEEQKYKCGRNSSAKCVIDYGLYNLTHSGPIK